MATDAELLAAHLPRLRYDSDERYFADAADGFLASPGVRLERADGTVLATAGPGLTLAELGRDPYPWPGAAGGSAAPLSTDRLTIPDRDYARRAAVMHAQPAFRDVVYGHATRDPDGATWLQYWCWYLYNDYNLIGHVLHAGRHEGDWEMVQLRLGDTGRPDLAVYAQHRSGEAREWDRVERLPGTERPVVYVARGSHAAYFEPGIAWTGVWFDRADGRRPGPDRLRLEILDPAAPSAAWVHWPGRWGDTPKEGGIAPADSPISPGTRKVWRDPRTLLDVARAAGPASRRTVVRSP